MRLRNSFIAAFAALFVTLGVIQLTPVVVLATGNTSNHPCPDGYEVVKDQPPNSGTTITVPAGYTNVTMLIKIASDQNGGGHLEVPYVSSGEVITPSSLSGWPQSEGGEYKEISHVDYCIPPLEWDDPDYPPFNPRICVEFRLEKFTSTWDENNGWSEWTDWPGSGPLGWNVMPDALTGHHGGNHGEDGDRHFAYQIVDERPSSDPACLPACDWPGVKTTQDKCGEIVIVPECAAINGSTTFTVTNKPTWVYNVWFNTSPPTNPADGTPGGLSFSEDENGGSVTVYYWVAGTENDALATQGFPLWNSPATVDVDTDCEGSTTTSTTIPETTTTTTLPEEPECIDINTASFEELLLLKHINVVRAQLIIDGRPFTSIDDLVDRVSGIGPVNVLDMLPDLCEFVPPTTTTVPNVPTVGADGKCVNGVWVVTNTGEVNLSVQFQGATPFQLQPGQSAEGPALATWALVTSLEPAGQLTLQRPEGCSLVTTTTTVPGPTTTQVGGTTTVAPVVPPPLVVGPQTSALPHTGTNSITWSLIMGVLCLGAGGLILLRLRKTPV